MGSFVFVTAVPAGALESVNVASNNCLPYGVRGGTVGSGLSFANASCNVLTILPEASKSPTLSGLLFQTPSRERGLYGMPTELNFASPLCCSGVRQWGQVFHPSGGFSAWASAAEDKANIAAMARIKTRILVCIVNFLSPRMRGLECEALPCRTGLVLS